MSRSRTFFILNRTPIILISNRLIPDKIRMSKPQDRADSSQVPVRQVHNDRVVAEEKRHLYENPRVGEEI